jgi:hypothetical protein
MLQYDNKGARNAPWLRMKPYPKLSLSEDISGDVSQSLIIRCYPIAAIGPQHNDHGIAELVCIMAVSHWLRAIRYK